MILAAKDATLAGERHNNGLPAARVSSYLPPSWFSSLVTQEGGKTFKKNFRFNAVHCSVY